MSGSISSKTLAWAHAKLGHQVGGGECWDLVDHALRAAGAKSSATTGGQDDYVWGTPIALQQVMPGDILQFRNFIVTTTIETVVRFPDGTGYHESEAPFARRPHHSAIVHRVLGSGKFRIYEQHVTPKGDQVQDHEVPTRNAAPVHKVSHEVRKTDDGRLRTATVETTTSISVSGHVWAYRPQPR